MDAEHPEGPKTIHDKGRATSLTEEAQEKQSHTGHNDFTETNEIYWGTSTHTRQRELEAPIVT